MSSKRRVRSVLTASDWETICSWRDENRHLPNQEVIAYFSKEENGALRFKTRTLQEHMAMWRKLHGKLDSRSKKTKARATALSRLQEDSEWMQVFAFADAHPGYSIRGLWLHFEERGLVNVCEGTFRWKIRDRSRIEERAREFVLQKEKLGFETGIDFIEYRTEYRDLPTTSQVPEATTSLALSEETTRPSIEVVGRGVTDYSTPSLLVSQGSTSPSKGLSREDSSVITPTPALPARLKRNRSKLTDNSDTAGVVLDSYSGIEKRPLSYNTTSSSSSSSPLPSRTSSYDEATSPLSPVLKRAPSSPELESRLGTQLEQLGLRIAALESCLRRIAYAIDQNLTYYSSQGMAQAWRVHKVGFLQNERSIPNLLPTSKDTDVARVRDTSTRSVSLTIMIHNESTSTSGKRNPYKSGKYGRNDLQELEMCNERLESL
ncbi:hypothetical protein FA13DRAFT_1773750 [Coprinellus micaceus]|uniref:Uncharacterized protein n=1 Tax=Coprinellus micaceus TaxID=71717 RepID=A0A4Y7TE09_COPMI|nr:hypothetical protein FA13DRAFT_1773750 [Coprinellus micaceus]